MQLKLARANDGEPEIFHSIQGEGRNTGRSRTFVRLSGCNLHCVWCDTAYTWNWEGTPFPHRRDVGNRPYKFKPAHEMRRVGVEEACQLALRWPTEGFVITGGEPLMQAQAVTALVLALKREAPNSFVEIETNGTIVPGPNLASAVDLFTVSPKLAHSGNGDAAIRPDAIRAIAGLTSSIFKFVVSDRSDVEVVVQFADEFGLSPERVYIMPEGTESAQLIERGRAIIDDVLRSGFNYTDRLHIHFWGSKRGV
jgi:7-carboxy-7-deazaguanine synthase